MEVKTIRPLRVQAGVAAWVAAMTILCGVRGVEAVELPPGGTVALEGTCLPGGTIVYDEVRDFEIKSASGALLFRGRLQNRVSRLETGMLRFAYHIRDTEGGLNGIVKQVLTESFRDFTTDVDYKTCSAGEIGPSQARRSFDGSELRFEFLENPLYSGQESLFFYALTNATAYNIEGTSTIELETGEGVTLPTAQPVWNIDPGCHDIDFEDLPAGADYPYGSAFVTNGVLVRVEEFFHGPGGCVNPTTNGSLHVGTNNYACGSGKELWIGNVNVSFDYGVPLAGLSLRYGEYGGHVNIEINGDCHNVANFADLPPMIGGVMVYVEDADEPGQGCGRIKLDGLIASFKIGGQEFAIDDVQCEVDPCAEDDVPPIAEMTSPPAQVCVCDPVTIVGTADDANFSHYVLEYRRATDTAWTTIHASSTPVVSGVLGVWNASGLAQGHYLLRLTATDLCGHSETAVNVVWLGTEFDNLTIRSPLDGAVVGGDVCIDGTVWDNYCFDEYAVLYRPNAGGSWLPVDPSHPVYTSTVINDPFATWDTVGTASADGVYGIRVTAVDDCGNDATEDVGVIVDNTAPNAEITDPTACSHVEGLVEVHGTARDRNLASWVLQYTGGDASGWVTIQSGTTSVTDGVLGTWDTTRLRRCAYTLRLVVTDQAVLNCNSAVHHRSEYTVSVIVGTCGDLDVDDDGDVDLEDYSVLQEQFTGPL